MIRVIVFSVLSWLSAAVMAAAPYSTEPCAVAESSAAVAARLQCGRLQVQSADGSVREPKVTIPAAIIWGLADKSHAATDRQSVKRYAPDAQYIEWDGIGHFTDIEAPEKLAEVALSLLSN